MIKIPWMSVCFGLPLLSPSSRFQLRLQAPQHQVIESLEQRLQVVRTRTRLGVSLEAESRLGFQCDPLQRAIEQRAMGRANVRWQSALVHCETMILTRDEHASRVEILHRVIRA